MGAKSLAQRFGKGFDDAISIIDPQRAYRRQIARFAYDALARDRTLPDRKVSDVPADSFLTEYALSELRAIAYDLSTNNPLIKGILLTEADDVVGTKLNIQARTEDEIFNKEIEQAFKEEMEDRACDITNRFNFLQVMHKSFLNYRTAGDFFLLFSDEGMQLLEGNQCGSPLGQKEFETFIVTNGVATSKKTGKVIGYYLGKPNKWGYISNKNYMHYPAEVVHHIFNPDRITYTRGEPILTSSVRATKALWRYYNEELDAASLNALLSLFVTVSNPSRVPLPFAKGRFPSGQDEKGQKVEKIEPWTIRYLNTDEDIKAIMANRPPTAFDQFVLRTIMLIVKPLCMPLMIATGDLSGATFMNARIANQHWEKNLRREQAHVVIPLAGRIRNWWLEFFIKNKKIKKLPEHPFRHEVICQKQNYVDPTKEATADKIRLESGTITLGMILDREGEDFREHCERMVREKKIRKEIIEREGFTEADFEPPKKENKNAIS